MFSKGCKIIKKYLHQITLALLILAPAPSALAGQQAIVFYLDTHYHPVTKLERLGEASEGMDAILAMYALQAGGGCEGSNATGLDCALTRSLGLGAQCSEKHLKLVSSWFRDEIPALSIYQESIINNSLKSGELASICYNAPDSATLQEFWEIIKVKRDDNLVTVDAIRGWFHGADGPTYRKRYTTEYRINNDSVTVVSHKEISLPAREW